MNKKSARLRYESVKMKFLDVAKRVNLKNIHSKSISKKAQRLKMINHT
jgi:hypothetical protein